MADLNRAKSPSLLCRSTWQYEQVPVNGMLVDMLLEATGAFSEKPMAYTFTLSLFSLSGKRIGWPELQLACWILRKQFYTRQEGAVSWPQLPVGLGE